MTISRSSLNNTLRISFHSRTHTMPKFPPQWFHASPYVNRLKYKHEILVITRPCGNIAQRPGAWLSFPFCFRLLISIVVASLSSQLQQMVGIYRVCMPSIFRQRLNFEILSFVPYNFFTRTCTIKKGKKWYFLRFHRGKERIGALWVGW